MAAPAKLEAVGVGAKAPNELVTTPPVGSPGKKNYLTAIQEALFEEMERNPDMICQGEDIGRLGGAFGVTEGLQAKYGSGRVIDAPISEAAIVGTAVGMALNGKTVMAEMQFIDFISCGFDQIVNNMATYSYRTAGEVNLPIVVRGPAGGYGGGALYHSQMNEAWFCNSPGLRAPSSSRSKSFTERTRSRRNCPMRTTSFPSERPPPGEREATSRS
ncbi:hypothetical protein EON79_13540 [bacterium]|nr:MAG: hypothetical protein EON79_13540 [bacterium]